MMKNTTTTTLSLLVLTVVAFSTNVLSWPILVSRSYEKSKKPSTSFCAGLSFAGRREPHSRTASKVSPINVLYATRRADKSSATGETKEPKKANVTRKVDVRNNYGYPRFEAFLRCEIGLKNQTRIMRIAQRAPSLLAYSEPRLNETFNLFREAFDLSNEDLQKLIQKESKIFCNTNRNLEAKMEAMSSKMFNGNMSAVGIVVQKQPGILMSQVETTTMPKVEYLRNCVYDGDDDKVTQLLLACPRILTISLNRRIIARAEALRQSGYDPANFIKTWSGLTKKDFEVWYKEKTGQTLQQDWCVESENELPCTYEERVLRIAKVLSSELDMDENDALRMLERHPPLKQRSLDYVRKKIVYLIDLMNGSKGDVRDTILKFPRLLTASVETCIQPKVEFFRQIFTSAGEDSDVALLKFIKNETHVFATYSLKKRIIPRIEAIEAAGLNINSINIGYAMTVPSNQFPAWIARQKGKSFS